MSHTPIKLPVRMQEYKSDVEQVALRLIDKDGVTLWYSHAAYFSKSDSRDRALLLKAREQIAYAESAINSHDRLTAEVKRLRELVKAILDNRGRVFIREDEPNELYKWTERAAKALNPEEQP